MDKVSIIIPIYNVERYLQECLDSVAGQTYDNLEIILVDDGATDSSGDICDRYAAVDPRVRVIHQTNAGAAAAKNRGLNMATGDYITFIDSDDWVEKTWIETMLSTAKAAGADLVECGVRKEYVGSTEVMANDPGEYTPQAYLAQYFQRWTNSIFWEKLFVRQLTESVRFRTERRCIDDEFYTYKIISNATKIIRIPDPLYHYRQRASSAVRSDANRRQITDDAMELRPERYEWIKTRFPDLKRLFWISDVDYLLYLAGTGLFDRPLAKKFRRIAGYYLKEGIRLSKDRRMIILWGQLLGCFPKTESQQRQSETNPGGKRIYFE